VTSLSPEVVLGLAERLEGVEREYRRLKRLTMWLMVVVAILLGLAVSLVVVSSKYGTPGSVAEMVASRQFVLRGEDGTIRGVWGTTDSGAVRLVLQDAQGRQRTKLDLLNDGTSGLAFADSTGHPRAVFAFLPSDETASLVFADGGGKTRSVLGVSAGGSATLVFADRGGITRAGLGVDQRGEGTFTLVDRSGRDAAQPEPEPSPPPEADTAAAPTNPTRRR
jgi:hypothetical protein